MQSYVFEDFRALLRRGNLTGSAAAEIAGVSPRTIRRWVGGQAPVPHDAWVKIQAHIDQHAPAAELPPLPPYEKADWQHGIITRYYTAEQMAEYARAAVELNRVRASSVCSA